MVYLVLIYSDDTILPKHFTKFSFKEAKECLLQNTSGSDSGYIFDTNKTLLYSHNNPLPVFRDLENLLVESRLEIMYEKIKTHFEKEFKCKVIDVDKVDGEGEKVKTLSMFSFWIVKFLYSSLKGANFFQQKEETEEEESQEDPIIGKKVL